jgi:pantoate--beta-alanine ligase
MASLPRKIFRQSCLPKATFRNQSPRWISSQASSLIPGICVVKTVPSLRSWRGSLPSSHTLGLVPTMGALHQGHISLARQAAEENTDVIISLYINPTQFGVNEDLSTYPRTWEADLAALNKLNEELSLEKGKGKVTCIWAPDTAIMYPNLPPSSEIDGQGSFVTITPLATRLEGASRPVFFRGVATVCMKLFNAVQPNNVYFGQKDFQQTAVIRRMIQDFHLPVKFRMGQTVRENDGLAMSSRNVYLGERRRTTAIALRKALVAGENAYSQGKLARDDIQGLAFKVLDSLKQEQDMLPENQRALFEIDYVSLADTESLDELETVDRTRGAVISGAIIMQPLEAKYSAEHLGLGGDIGTVRLIDNIVLKPRH